MNSARRTAALPAVGFPIRTSSDQSLVSGSPGLFAATHVLLRLLSPRHPSCALCSLVISLPSSFKLLFEKTRVQRGSVVNRIPRRTDTFQLPTCAYAVVKERYSILVASPSIRAGTRRPRANAGSEWGPDGLCPAGERVGNPLSNGADRDRTDDIQLAKLALSQLSYGPVRPRRGCR